jgi:hypothetical protein
VIDDTQLLRLEAIKRNSRRGFVPSTDERDFLLEVIEDLLNDLALQTELRRT